VYPGDICTESCSRFNGNDGGGVEKLVSIGGRAATFELTMGLYVFISSSQNLTPNQLFIQGALRQNMTPALPRPVPVHSSSGIQLSTPHDAVGVRRSAFAACDDLKSELDQLVKCTQRN
jgi:hypothetical protein